MNIALIGLGMVAATHVAAIRSSKQGLNLRGVLGRNPERTKVFAGRHDTQAYSSAQEIAQDPSVDFTLLATPPNARIEIIRVLAAAGKPVLMEKPIERDLTAARRVVEIGEAAGTPFGVIFQHRARKASIALISALQSGALGEVATVDLRIPWWRDQNYYASPGRGTYARDGGGVMISQAIHTLDLAMWMLGPIAYAQALMRRTPLHQLEAEDWAAALFEMENGVVGTLMATTAAFPGAAETITIQGTNASAHLGAGTLTITYLDGRTETVGATAATGGGADPMGFTHAWHQSVIEDFADAVSNNRPPMIPARDGLLSHAVIDAMQLANQTGQRTKVQV